MDIVDEINSLLKLGVGDSYRLEHIKQAYIQNNTIWITDNKYLQQLKEKYLDKHSPDDIIDSESDAEIKNKAIIHCWKCGKINSLKANFCMNCGASVFEIGKKSNTQEKEINKSKLKFPPRFKTLLLIGISILILIIIGSIVSQGLDYSSEDTGDTDYTDTLPPKDTGSSRCGAGTVFDPQSNSCVLR